MNEVEHESYENWSKGWEAASKLAFDSDYLSVVARAKIAAIFGKLLDRGLDPEDLEAAVKEVIGDGSHS